MLMNTWPRIELDKEKLMEAHRFYKGLDVI
jgi:hypothetical protein